MDLNFKKWVLLKKMSLNYNPKEELCIKEFANKIGTTSAHPYFIELMKELVEKRIVILQSSWCQAKIVKLNIKELDKFIEDNIIWREFTEYVHSKKLLYADI